MLRETARETGAFPEQEKLQWGYGDVTEKRR